MEVPPNHPILIIFSSTLVHQPFLGSPILRNAHVGVIDPFGGWTIDVSEQQQMQQPAVPGGDIRAWQSSLINFWDANDLKMVDFSVNGIGNQPQDSLAMDNLQC